MLGPSVLRFLGRRDIGGRFLVGIGLGLGLLGTAQEFGQGVGIGGRRGFLFGGLGSGFRFRGFRGYGFGLGSRRGFRLRGLGRGSRWLLAEVVECLGHGSRHVEAHHPARFG